MLYQEFANFFQCDSQFGGYVFVREAHVCQQLH